MSSIRLKKDWRGGKKGEIVSAPFYLARQLVEQEIAVYPGDEPKAAPAPAPAPVPVPAPVREVIDIPAPVPLEATGRAIRKQTVSTPAVKPVDTVTTAKTSEVKNG